MTLLKVYKIKFNLNITYIKDCQNIIYIFCIYCIPEADPGFNDRGLIFTMVGVGGVDLLIVPDNLLFFPDFPEKSP